MNTPAVHFANPTAPRPTILVRRHDHDLVMIGADLAPNGVWFSRWACTLCPDHFAGDPVGPVPADYCPCGWVQKKSGRHRCEDCKRPLERGAA